MPVDWSDYPPDWQEIAVKAKDAVDWVCQGCGKQCRRPGEPFDTHKRTLTCHHPHHDKANPNAVLEVLCAPCHLRADAKHHAANARVTRLKKRGQLALDAGIAGGVTHLASGERMEVEHAY